MKKVWLILLLLFGTPLVFFGSCFSVGLVSMETFFADQGVEGLNGGLMVGLIAGLIVAIWFVWYMLKEIKMSKHNNETEEEQRKRGIVYDPSRKKHNSGVKK